MTEAEKRENWLKIPVRAYSAIPPGSIVMARVGPELVPMKVNSRGYMWPQLLLWDQFVHLLSFDEDEDELIFEKEPLGVLRISRRKKR